MKPGAMKKEENYEIIHEKADRLGAAFGSPDSERWILGTWISVF